MNLLTTGTGRSDYLTVAQLVQGRNPYVRHRCGITPEAVALTMCRCNPHMRMRGSYRWIRRASRSSRAPEQKPAVAMTAALRYACQHRFGLSDGDSRALLASPCNAAGECGDTRLIEGSNAQPGCLGAIQRHRVPSRSICVAVGQSSRGTLAEMAEGAQRSIASTPNPARAAGGGLSAIACPSSTTCFAVSAALNSKPEP
jgi:hypothetical protein